MRHAAAAAHYDVIVVGGGAAGCVLASRLSDDPSRRILLVEAGGDARRAIVRHPAGVRWLVGNPRYDWKRTVEPDASVGGRAPEWPAGKLLGGGGSINTMFYIWGERADFDWWSAMGASGWDYDSVLPFYRRLERCGFGDASIRGDGGPLAIRSLAPDAHPITRGFVAGLERSGFRLTDDYNRDHAPGSVAYGQVNQRRGRRSSPAIDYPGMDGRRANLDIVCETLCDRLTFDGRRASGVVVRDRRGVRTIMAGDEIVLSAGAVATPAILLRSGIGPAATLASIGVRTRLDRPGVGCNLQEHCGVRLVRGTSMPSINQQLRSPAVIGAALRYLRGRGLLTDLVSQASAFFLADDADPLSKAKLSIFPFGYETRDGKLRLAKTGQAMFTVDLCWPNARGQVSIRSADPADQPVISYPMLSHPLDRRWMTAAVAKVQTWLSGATFEGVFGRSVQPPADDTDQRSLDSYVAATIEPFYHASGTCRIGSGTDAVVDPRLRVIGLSGLRIADTSIMPRLVSANSNATAMMIGERAADLLAADIAR